ncbi:hypothetical protein P6144_16425 [Sphingomonas sp. HITSZ_GF]|uniref:hypothetical protein n=1 Tax=Sphingomonas sp. HITSZ_GF TaxID=3037247 RepID=UPI00240D528A|nr:hypothetical protein [Sphingomonas sp. HITSZ_GF]MDG2535248.1 hypothetical protein [Sphingomonas sp. HITSZ_GF]
MQRAPSDQTPSPKASSPQVADDIAVLRGALEALSARTEAWEQRSDVTTLEIVRGLDMLFCAPLFMARNRDPVGRIERTLMRTGCNRALWLVLPSTPIAAVPRWVPSHPTVQAKVDRCLFDCGSLQTGERLLQWLREGLLGATFREHDGEPVLTLHSADPSLYDEHLGSAGLAWASGDRMRAGRPLANELAKRFKTVAREIERSCDLVEGNMPVSLASLKLDALFQSVAEYYFTGTRGRDLIGDEDTFGGLAYSAYVAVLTALAARGHRHLADVSALRIRYPDADLRTLLTTLVEKRTLIEHVHLITDLPHEVIEQALESMTLTGKNADLHLGHEEGCWAPLIETNAEWLIAPLFGLEANPFMFLLRDLRFRYPSEWFEAANRREKRWLEELELEFARDGIRTNAKCAKLKRDGKVVTDVDYAVYEPATNELTVFQLKWQQLVSGDNRSRRSLGKNLIEECNKWIDRVSDYAQDFGTDALARVLGFSTPEPPQLRLMVVARYHAHFSGYADHDRRAVWTSWDNLRKALRNVRKGTVRQVMAFCARNERDQRGVFKPESFAFPVADLGVMLNPTREPHA